MKNQQRTIGIFGHSRGGTSATAGVVRLLGVHLFSNRISNDDGPLHASIHPGSIIAVRNAEYDVWGFKHPALLGRVQQLQRELRNPHFIFVSRDPVASLSADRDVFEALDLQEAEQRSFEFFDAVKKCTVPFIVISYEKLVKNPQAVVYQIADFIGTPVNHRAVAFVNQSKGYQKVDDFLKDQQ